jgi:hypothetical protein
MRRGAWGSSAAGVQLESVPGAECRLAAHISGPSRRGFLWDRNVEACGSSSGPSDADSSTTGGPACGIGRSRRAYRTALATSSRGSRIRRTKPPCAQRTRARPRPRTETCHPDARRRRREARRMTAHGPPPRANGTPRATPPHRRHSLVMTFERPPWVGAPRGSASASRNERAPRTGADPDGRPRERPPRRPPPSRPRAPSSPLRSPAPR